MSSEKPELEIAELQNEVAGLKAQMREMRDLLESVLSTSSSGGKRLEVESLRVVNSDKTEVAEISETGLISGRNLSILDSLSRRDGGPVRGVVIDGKQRKIIAKKIQLTDETSDPGIEAICSGKKGMIRLRNAAGNAGVDLQGEGGALIAYSEEGTGTVILHPNHPEGGSIQLNSYRKDSNASVRLEICHLTQEPTIRLLDEEGKIIERIPAQEEGAL